MLQLIASNRLEALADALAQRLEAQPLRDPRAAERIVVPHSGVGRWLQLRLAQRWGVAAQLRFELPAQTMGQMLAALPALQGDSSLQAAWERPALRWRLLALLGKLPTTREFAVLRGYLTDATGDSDPLKPWQLAGRLADVLDAYQVYRPDWLLTWSGNRRALPVPADGISDDEIWQSALWRRLLAELPLADRGTRLLALIDALLAGTLPPHVLPTRLSLFGALPLSPLQMRWVSALAARTDVAVYHCAPSAAFWGDLRSPREQARGRAARRTRPAANELADLLTPAAALLTSLGSRAREAQQLQIEHWLDGSVETERWVTPDTQQPLGWLQAAMLDLDERAPPDPGQHSNLCIHACASPRREVEVLLDALLDCFQRDPSLRPHQVAIMAPSLDRYAPLIEAVLASTPPERRIPITLADGRSDRLHPLVQRYLWLLRLPQAGFTRIEVLGLLECAPLRARFELSDEGLEWLRTWAAELGVVCGLSAAQREALGEGAASAHTWAAAVERLLMGQAAGDAGGLLDGVAPFAADDGAAAALALGALWRLLRELERWRLRLAALPAGGDPVAPLRQLFDAFFLLDDTDSDAADAAAAVADALQAIAEQLALADIAGSPGIDALIAAVEDALAQPARWQRFLGEGATVCAMVPLRSVPFRVIAVLGLDDGAFPRRTPPAGFDLMRQAPRPGDRSPREDDRQLLLDTVLAAREHLHLSFVGMDPTDGAARPPAAPLAELVDTLRLAYAQRWAGVAQRMLMRHPLAPWAAVSFAGDAGSFAQQWWPARQAEQDGWRAPRPFVARPILLSESSAGRLDVGRLLRFYRNPARAFLGDVLRLSRARWIEDQAGDEPHSIDRRAARALLARMLDASVRGMAIGDCVARIAAEGQLPAGLAGQRALQDLSERFDATLDLIGVARLRQTATAIEVQIDRLPVTGQLVWLGDAKGLLLVGIDEPDAAALLTLALTRELLIHAGALAPGVDCCYFEVPLNNSPRRHRLARLEDMKGWMTALAEGWSSGQVSPLPLPQRSAWAYARRWAKGHDHAAAVEASSEVWRGNERGRGESADSDLAIAFRGIEVPELDAFAGWSQRIYAPLVGALHTERRG